MIKLYLFYRNNSKITFNDTLILLKSKSLFNRGSKFDSGTKNDKIAIDNHNFVIFTGSSRYM